MSDLLAAAPAFWAALTYPEFDPIAIEFGPLAIRWYALAYIGGLLGAWWYCRWAAARSPYGIKRDDIDDFLVWATLGVVLGGRLGYVLFYKPGYYLEHPLEIFAIWQGGMAFHGGFLGVIGAMFLFARVRRIPYFALTDIVGAATPIGLFLGRIANFINGELYGRVSDSPLAMIFPHGGPDPRHPSQLYQAVLEGLVLFLVLFVMIRLGALRWRGMLSGAFLIGYGLARLVGEIFRQPDAHLGFIVGPVTMGQLLSLPMVLGGIYLVLWARRHPAPA